KQNKPQQNLQTNNDLSERQMLILKLISEGRTNADIAEIIGYSESLIRQETIRIYSLLGCSGRNEATNLFHQMQNLDTDDAIPATTVSV
ncbi:MAG: Bacterial regulatory protein luxR family, partial [Actinomycetota bacterium]